MGVGSVAAAFVAGVLTALSPCVLPILPIVLGAAASERKYGPAALAAGLAISFVAIGLFVATIGYSVGLTTELFRQIAAALMILLGAILLLPNLQARLAMANGPIANWTDRRFGTQRDGGYAGQFSVGLILGAVWSPCVGPTLGAASLMAAQRNALPEVGATMALFAIGATFPLLALGRLSSRISANSRGSLLALGHRGKIALGAVAGATGLLIMTGFERPLESFLVAVSPPWLTRLTTSF
jgi:cytochrome c biogenesis protein CcdA